MNDITIRPATLEDAGPFLRLVEELAVYEKMAPPDAEAKARLIEHLFGPRPFYQLVLAVKGGRPVGYAAYFFTYSTFVGRRTLYLEDLFVLPEARGDGVGHKLLVTIARIALAEGCGRLDLIVLKWNELAHRFYEKHGVNRMEDWALYRLSGDEIASVAAMPDA